MSGNDGGEVTPVPIPNTAVKLSSADGSWDFVSARVGRCRAINHKVNSGKISTVLLKLNGELSELVEGARLEIV